MVGAGTAEWLLAARRLASCIAPHSGVRPSSFVICCAQLPPRYKYRLVVDESVALGMLGATGRGAAQAAGLSTKDVDIVAASLSALLRLLASCAGLGRDCVAAAAALLA